MTTNHITQAMANPEIIVELGRRFKEYRLTYRLTQKEAAEKAGVSLITLRQFENGKALSEYFKAHRSITCARMQQVCGMTRSTAYRRLQALTQGAHPSLQREGYKNATAYIPVKGHYGRSYTADRW